MKSLMAVMVLTYLAVIERDDLYRVWAAILVCGRPERRRGAETSRESYRRSNEDGAPLWALLPLLHYRTLSQYSHFLSVGLSKVPGLIGEPQMQAETLVRF